MTQRSEMASSIGALLDGTLAGEAAIDFLRAVPLETLSPEQLAGAVEAVMERAVPFPHTPDAIDGCGTGGDGRATYNISTAAALVVAACGIPVAKHGNRSVTSKSGSADVLGALGVHTHITPEHTARILEKTGICFLYAPIFHPGFARVAPLRQAIGKRTIFNVLGPLCNPAGVTRQLIGVFAPEYVDLMAETCQLLGRRRVMIAHGDDGTDEMSITGHTRVSFLHDGSIERLTIHPLEAGLKPSPGRALTGGDALQNAKALRAVLENEESAYADAVLLNAATMLLVAEKVEALHEGTVMARSAIASGAAIATLNALIEASTPDA